MILHTYCKTSDFLFWSLSHNISINHLSWYHFCWYLWTLVSKCS